MSTILGARPIDTRHATAARNAESVLDAAEQLLAGGRPLNYSALARDAGVSRPTVYAHFPDQADLVAAVVERSLRRVVAAIESAHPADGPPVDALRRTVQASWKHLAHHHDLARAVGGHPASASIDAAHHDAMSLFDALAARGRADGSFRRDLPPSWLVTAGVGLIHSAVAAVQSGAMRSDSAQEALTTSIVELWVGPAPRRS